LMMMTYNSQHYFCVLVGGHGSMAIVQQMWWNWTIHMLKKLWGIGCESGGCMIIWLSKDDTFA
jgi:hypothetical protein